ncbi:MAG: hypothetical protein U0234_28180 [Sandaracinus sp.]
MHGPNTPARVELNRLTRAPYPRALAPDSFRGRLIDANELQRDRRTRALRQLVAAVLAIVAVAATPALARTLVTHAADAIADAR